MAAHADEPNTALRYQAPRKPLSRTEQLGDLSHGQMALNAAPRLAAITPPPRLPKARELARLVLGVWLQ